MTKARSRVKIEVEGLVKGLNRHILANVKPFIPIQHRRSFCMDLGRDALESDGDFGPRREFYPGYGCFIL